jgi:large subunit ribosomal protein L29
MKNEALDVLLKEQVKLKMQSGVGQLSQHHLLRKVRKDIARHKTFARQAELREESSND